MKKKIFKRIFAILCAALMLVPAFSACNDEEAVSDEPSNEQSDSGETAKVITVGEREFTLNSDVNKADSENGVYLFTREYGKLAVPKIDANDNKFFDAVVIDGVVIEINDRGSSAVIPEDGYVLRFRGIEDSGIKLGDEVKRNFDDAAILENHPDKYVSFGNGAVIEIGYENTTRTAEDTGWLYDSCWYTGNTMNNVYCTEIAIADGKVLEINRSGDDVAGIAIPEGGYVLTVGQGSVNERKLADLKVGDSAHLVESDGLYSVNRFGFSGKDRKRPSDGITVFTYEAQKTTPVGEGLTEVVVNDVGIVTEIIVSSNGMNKIPENGFVISATGNAAAKLARTVKSEAEVFEAGTRSIYIVSTPTTELARYKKERDAIVEAYKSSVETLAHIDFEMAASLISKISENISKAEATLGLSEVADIEYNGFDGEILAECIKELQTLTKRAKKELVPNITVQDRAAWVTLGEYNYDGSLLLHYRTQAEVDHAVNYAKLSGLNTLIIDNLAAGFAVYDSEIEGLVKLPQLGGLDLIEAFAEACDEQGIRLIVMVNAFSSGLSTVTYPDGHYMKIYKDKYLLTNKGRVAGSDNVITLDPADKDVQAYNLAVISEIAEKYDIYGVQADYMRYPLPYYYQEHNYEDFGYNESSVSGFIKKYGKDPAKLKISDPLWEKWCAWRRDIISEYQKKFYQTVKGINPELHVSFTCFADYRDRQIFTYQDVEKWAENGYADAIYPMIYGDTTEYQLKYAEEILPVTEHTALILGVGTYVKASHQSIQEQFIMPHELCAEGISIFTLRYNVICGYNETICNAFRNPATPATADDAALIAASSEMLSDRIYSLKYAARFSESLNESDGESLSLLAEKIIASGQEKTGFAEFCSELANIKASIESGETAVPEKVKEALLQDLDYIISLQ